MEQTKQIKHKGPPLGILALVFAGLFITGLSFVISFTPGAPRYPGPWESPEVITAYFKNHAHDAMMCALFQFGSAVPLAIFTATASSRLHFLGSRAAGNTIALVGGLITAVNIMVSSLVLWVMSGTPVSPDHSVMTGLYYLAFAIGGVGYSVPMGILIAGISVTSGFMRILPKWVVWSGILVALCGELSWLNLAFPKLLPLIPLTRFLGFIWLVIAGFLLPTSRECESRSGRIRECGIET